MEPEGLLRHSQEPSPVPLLSQIDPVHAPSHFSNIHFNITFSSTPGSCNLSPSPRCLHQNPVCTSPYMLDALPNSVFLIWSPELYLVRSTNHKASHYVVFSSPLLPRPSWTQISSSAPYSRKSSAYIPASLRATKFHTHRSMYQLSNTSQCCRCQCDSCINRISVV